MDPWKHATGASLEQAANSVTKSVTSDDNPVNARILGLVVDLGNTVLTKKAAGELHAWVFPRQRPLCSRN